MANDENPLKRLERFYGKHFSPDQLSEWAAMLTPIAPVALADVVDQTVRQDRFFPTPQVLLDRWVEWRKNNADRIKPRDIQPCGYCHDGFIFTGVFRHSGSDEPLRFAYRPGDQPDPFPGDGANWYEQSLPCAMCGNFRTQFRRPGFARFPELEGRGHYLAISPGRFKHHGVPLRKPLDYQPGETFTDPRYLIEGPPCEDFTEAISRAMEDLRNET